MVERFEVLVYSVARRNGLDPDDASDVTQTTFALLLRQIHAVRDVERLSSWLATVARREAWRVARLRKRSAQPVPVDRIDDPVASWEQGELVLEAVTRLGEPCRQLIQWMFLDPERPSHAEIATRLGRAVGGIGSLRCRCLERLRVLIEDRGDA